MIERIAMKIFDHVNPKVIEIVNDCLTSLCLLAIIFADKKESLRIHNARVLSSDLILTEQKLKCLLFN